MTVITQQNLGIFSKSSLAHAHVKLRHLRVREEFLKTTECFEITFPSRSLQLKLKFKNYTDLEHAFIQVFHQINNILWDLHLFTS